MTRPSPALALLALCLIAEAPAFAAEEPPIPVIQEDMERIGWGALATLDATLNHGFGFGSTLKLELHRGDSALQLSLIGSRQLSYMLNDADLTHIAGGTLLSPTLGLRYVLTRGTPFLQPWVAGAFGYGWFWFSDSDVKEGALGIDSGRLAWFAEAGADLLTNGMTLTASFRVLSSPVGLLYTLSLNFLLTD